MWFNNIKIKSVIYSSVLSLLLHLFIYLSFFYFCWINSDFHLSGFEFQELFFRYFVNILMAPVITGNITHFTFHTTCVSLLKLMHLFSFLLPFVWYSNPLLLPHLSVRVVSLLVFNYYIRPIWRNFFFCVYPCFHKAVTSLYSHTGCSVLIYHFFLLSLSNFAFLLI
jgi:hypothetical protein